MVNTKKSKILTYYNKYATKQFRISRKVGVLVAFILGATLAFSQSKAPGLRLCVFVPGVAAGSPIYEELVSGAQRAAKEAKATIKIVEAGYDQATWKQKLKAIAASREYDLIVSSNPSIPDFAREIGALFPEQRFFIADAWLQGNPAIHTVLYNQLEEGYIGGYLAGLVTNGMAGTTAPSHKAGIILSQHYPTLDVLIIPGLLRGLTDADPSAILEQRVIGNWYDAGKASELSINLINSGINVIIPIAGAASQGVLSAAGQGRAKVIWFDNNGYDKAPGVIIGCTILRQENLVFTTLQRLLKEGSHSELYGKARVVGVRDGFIDFDSSGAAYKSLPDSLRKKLEAKVSDLRTGQFELPFSGFPSATP